MNLAVSALVILLVALPGIAFSYTYTNGAFWTSPVSLRKFTEEAALNVLLAGLLHYLTVQVCNAVLLPLLRLLGSLPPIGRLLPVPALRRTDIEPDFERLLQFATGRYGPDDRALAETAGQFEEILWYFLVAACVGLCCGYALNVLVRFFCLDLRFEVLRFPHAWDYYFQGKDEFLSTVRARRPLLPFLRRKLYTWRELRKLMDAHDATLVTAVVEQKVSGDTFVQNPDTAAVELDEKAAREHGFVYVGHLQRYHFDPKTGQLERLILQGGGRFPLPLEYDHKHEEDPPVVPHFYPIRSSVLSIDRAHIRTLTSTSVSLKPRIFHVRVVLADACKTPLSGSDALCADHPPGFGNLVYRLRRGTLSVTLEPTRPRLGRALRRRSSAPVWIERIDVLAGAKNKKEPLTVGLLTTERGRYLCVRVPYARLRVRRLAGLRLPYTWWWTLETPRSGHRPEWMPLLLPGERPVRLSDVGALLYRYWDQDTFLRYEDLDTLPELDPTTLTSRERARMVRYLT